jgi:hypothetical protein
MGSSEKYGPSRQLRPSRQRSSTSDAISEETAAPAGREGNGARRAAAAGVLLGGAVCQPVPGRGRGSGVALNHVNLMLRRVRRHRCDE